MGLCQRRLGNNLATVFSGVGQYFLEFCEVKDFLVLRKLDLELVDQVVLIAAFVGNHQKD